MSLHAAIGRIVVLLITIITIDPTVPIDVSDTRPVGRRAAAVGVTTVASTVEVVEDTIRGRRLHGLAGAHVAELRATAELLDVTARDDGGDVALHGVSGVEATAVELVDVGILDLPDNVAIGMVRGVADTLLTGTGQNAEAAAVDVALGIVVVVADVAAVEAGKVELVVVATRHGDGRVLGGQRLVLVGTAMELLEPHVAAHMVIGSLVGCAIVLTTYPLLDDTALKNERSGRTVLTVVLELRDAEQRGVGGLEPADGLADTEVIGTVIIS